MEKPKTQAEVRRNEFTRHAKIAKDLAQLSMQEIDDALADYYHDSYDNYQHTLNGAVSRGDISEEEAQDALVLYAQWLEKGSPITDEDTLASPIGYYQTESLFD